MSTKLKSNKSAQDSETRQKQADYEDKKRAEFKKKEENALKLIRSDPAKKE